MAAEATFILRAVDATKAAFASVQNSLAKTFQSDAPTKFAAKFLGIQQAASLIAQEIRSVIENIDSIPNVPEKTLQSFNELKYNLSNTKAVIDSVIIKGLSLFTTVGTGIGKFFGGLVYGQQAVIDSEKAVNAEAQRFAAIPLEKKLLEIADAKERIGKSNIDLVPLLQDEMQALTNFANTGIVDLGKLDSAALKSFAKNVELNKGESKSLRDEAVVKAAGIKNTLLQTSIGLEEQIKKLEIDIAGKNVEFFNRDIDLRGQINNLTKDLIFLENSKPPLVDATDILGRQKTLEWLQKVQDANTKIYSLSQKQKETGIEAGKMIASGFEEAVFSGKKLSEVLKALALDLVRLVFQKQVTEVAATGIGKFINTALGFKAMGGPVSSGSPYVVGEKGPELFVPNSSGSIIPNSKMGSGSGGAGGTNVNVTYNIASGVSRSDLAPILEQQRKQLKAEIPDMVRRGGGYRAAFA